MANNKLNFFFCFINEFTTSLYKYNDNHSELEAKVVFAPLSSSADTAIAKLYGRLMNENHVRAHRVHL